MKHRRRPKGEGSIVHRSDGRWAYVIDHGKDTTTGKRSRTTLYARDRAELVRKIQDERARGGGAIRPKKREPGAGTVGEFLQRFLDEVIEPNRRRSTYELYKYLIEKWVEPFVGDARLSTFGPEDVSALYSMMRNDGIEVSQPNGKVVKKKASQQTCLQVSKVLGRAFALRSRKDGVPNPVALVERPKHESREIRVLSSKEARAFLSTARDDAFEALWVLLLTTGLRIGEALALTWDDVDLSGRRLHVRRAVTEVAGVAEIGPPKTKRSLRTLPLTPIAVEALKRRRQAYDAAGLEKLTSLVFSTGRGTVVLRGNLRRSHFDEILKRAKLARVSIHSLRHASATMLAELGTPVPTIVEILGHTRPSTALRHYLHSNEDAQREAFARLGRSLKKKR